MNTDDLLKNIEELRQEMIQLGLASSFLDERVIQLSDQLDQLLIKYQYMISSAK